MFLQFSEPALGRTRSTRKDSERFRNSFGIGLRPIRAPVRSQQQHQSGSPVYAVDAVTQAFAPDHRLPFRLQVGHEVLKVGDDPFSQTAQRHPIQI